MTSGKVISTFVIGGFMVASTTFWIAYRQLPSLDRLATKQVAGPSAGERLTAIRQDCQIRLNPNHGETRDEYIRRKLAEGTRVAQLQLNRAMHE